MGFLTRQGIFIIISLLVIFLILSSLFVLFNSFNIISIILFLFVLGNSLFLMSAVWYFLTQKREKTLEKTKEKPSVAVACTFVGESMKFVKKTLNCMKKLNYKNKTLYFLDDSQEEEIKKEMKFFCKNNNIKYITRKDRKGFKSGNLNNFLFNYCKEKFLIIFDKDDYKLINKNLISDLLPFFKDVKLAYVQTKKMTTKGSIFENAMRETNALFYNLIQPINNKTNSALFGGSLALMKVDIIKKLGGFPNFLIEDVAYSFKVFLNGYKGRYINKNYVLSHKIESFKEFQKQHFRYNFSNTNLFFKYYLPNFFKIPFHLHYHFLLQFLGLHFLSLSQIISCILVVFFMVYLPSSIYLSISLILFISLFPILTLLISKEYADSYKIGFIAYLVNYSLVFTRISAAVRASLGFKPLKYGATGIGRKKLKLKKVIRGSIIEIIFFICLIFPLFFIPYNPFYFILLFWNALLFLTTLLFLYLFD